MNNNPQYDAFICYSRQDLPHIRQIASRLEENSIRCFTDYNSIGLGENFVKVIQKNLVECKVILFFISENTIQKFTVNSWLYHEIKYALSIGKTIIPIRLDKTPFPEQLQFLIGHLNYLEWYNGDDDCLPLLLRSIHHFIDAQSESVPALNRRDEEIQNEILRLNNYTPQKVDYDIFISYRRSNGRDIARSIMKQLEILGYKKIFFDYNSLRNGVFNTQILDAIYSCKDFLLLLSPQSMDRCAEKGDWVAREIRTAIKYNRNIIPITLETDFSWPTEFPYDLYAIQNIQRHKLLVDEYFEDSLKRLSERLSSIIIEEATNVIHYKLITNKNCIVNIDGEDCAILEKDQLRKIPLRPGEYYIVITDCENPQNVIKKAISIEKDKVEQIQL